MHLSRLWTDTQAQKLGSYSQGRVAILAEVQAGRPTIIHKDGGEMLIAIVLDRPLAETKALVDDPAAFTREMTRILREKQNHPLIAQMIRPQCTSMDRCTVAKKTQVNSTTNQNGTSRKREATNRYRPEQKGPNRADKGGQNGKQEGQKAAR